jgi:hypothetical protein
MSGNCPHHHENLPCSMCAAIARPHAACDARIKALESERDSLAATVERMREALERIEDEVLDMCPYFTGDAERKQTALDIARDALAATEEGE